MNALSLLCLLGVTYFGVPRNNDANLTQERTFWPFNGPLAASSANGPLPQAYDFYWYLPALPNGETCVAMPEGMADPEKPYYFGVGYRYSPERAAFLMPAPLPPPSPALTKIKSLSVRDQEHSPFRFRVGSSFEMGDAPERFSADDWRFLALSDPDDRMRFAAVKALIRGKSEYASAALLTTLSHDPNPAVREAAAQALAGLRASDALLPLKRAVEHDADAGVRRTSRLALAILQPELQENVMGLPTPPSRESETPSKLIFEFGGFFN
jgi:hypothetical protein